MSAVPYYTKDSGKDFLCGFFKVSGEKLPFILTERFFRLFFKILKRYKDRFVPIYPPEKIASVLENKNFIELNSCIEDLLDRGESELAEQMKEALLNILEDRLAEELNFQENFPGVKDRSNRA